MNESHQNLNLRGETDVQAFLPELTENVSLLETIYHEYQHTIGQLRDLVTQYQQIQKSTRMKMRGIQMQQLRQVKSKYKTNSFTKTKQSTL